VGDSVREQRSRARFSQAIARSWAHRSEFLLGYPCKAPSPSQGGANMLGTQDLLVGLVIALFCFRATQCGGRSLAQHRGREMVALIAASGVSSVAGRQGLTP
jgi:hypothetical protein